MCSLRFIRKALDSIEGLFSNSRSPGSCVDIVNVLHNKCTKFVYSRDKFLPLKSCLRLFF